ncbi:hypothetical protein COLO4_19297 [Corchorus olitorius]|uniref:Uncharacterized protein n=1 Tax=Corchorus olitorius TaxID=93759 RepID=A0A1R3J5W1_9ROSI|nr:hypothetical protein COLO4_19297 [Corchorus olitorius]
MEKDSVAKKANRIEIMKNGQSFSNNIDKN